MSKRKLVSGYELLPEVSGNELEVPPPKKLKALESPSLSSSTSYPNTKTQAHTFNLSTHPSTSEIPQTFHPQILGNSPQYDAGKSSPVLDVQDISDAPRVPICSLPDVEAPASPIAAKGGNRAPVSVLLEDELSLDENSEEDCVPEKGVPSILGSGTGTSRQSVLIERVMDQISTQIRLMVLGDSPNLTSQIVRQGLPHPRAAFATAFNNYMITYAPLSPETQVEPPVPAFILPMGPSIDGWVMRDRWGDPVDPDMPPLERHDQVYPPR